MRSPPAPGARCAGAGDPGSAMERISCDRGCGGASLAMPGMRGPGGKDRATAVQGAVQQAVRRDRGGSLRECRRQSGGAAFPLAGDHRARDRHALRCTQTPCEQACAAPTVSASSPLRPVRADTPGTPATPESPSILCVSTAECTQKRHLTESSIFEGFPEFLRRARKTGGETVRKSRVIVNLIGNTTTKTGLRIQTGIDSQIYPTGIEVPDEVMGGLNMEKSEFHGEWNYRILPRPT